MNYEIFLDDKTIPFVIFPYQEDLWQVDFQYGPYIESTTCERKPIDQRQLHLLHCQKRIQKHWLQKVPHIYVLNRISLNELQSIIITYYVKTLTQFARLIEVSEVFVIS